ncbi:hypothetical protein D3C81_2252930 [compost metagenome]
MSKARLRKIKKENASSQKDGSICVAALPPRIRKVYRMAKVTMSTISMRLSWIE